MAAGLAAAIKNKFGLQADLIQGHDGIYEIMVNETLVYSNEACEHPPVDEDVFAEISQYRAPLKRETTSPTNTAAKAPLCAWTPPTPQSS